MILRSNNTHAAEAGHWYTTDGSPCYEVEAAQGGMRPTTLRDARKLNLVPGVTTIIRMAAAPGLENWKAEQLLLAGLTLPRRPDELEAAWLDRVRQDSREQARKAAERGTALHASLQGHFEGIPPPVEHFKHVHGAVLAINRWLDVKISPPWIAEQSFAHTLGFGGKCDLRNPNRVIDFKTKEFTIDLPKTWFEHAMQLAAYRHGFGMGAARCAICFVSVTEPGLAHLVEIDEDDLTRGWQCFRALLEFWQAKNRYKSAFNVCQ